MNYTYLLECADKTFYCGWTNDLTARLAAHNRVTIQFRPFPKWVGDACMLLSDGVWLFFNIVMVVESLTVIRELREFPYATPALDWQLSYIYFIFPIAFTLMSARIIQVNVMKFVLKKELTAPDRIETEETREAMSPAGVLFATFAVLMLLGSPITVALGVAAMAALYTVDQNLVTLVQIAFTSVNSFPIMALPAFMLVGALMECAGISRRLVAIAENIVGPIPGGLAVSTALACVFFGAISGSGPATTAAVGMLMIPAMIRRGFSKGYAAAAAATAGGVGIIIPPSIPMVVYAVSGQQSITKMFLAGVMPGIMIAVGLAAMHLFLCRNMPVAEDLQSGSGASLLKALKDGLWSLMAPVVILGGIYGGFFTPTEAAVVAIFYSIFVGLFIHRELTFGGIRHSLQITSWMTGRVLIIMFTAYAFERLLVQYRIPDMIVEHILGFTSDVAVIWMFVIALLLFLGMFMETLAIILLATPVLLPVMTAFGVDPIHFGVVLVCCCGVGFSTPPLGENIFIASGIADTTLEDISYNALPFVFVTVGVIILCVFVPDIVLFLPRMMY